MSEAKPTPGPWQMYDPEYCPEEIYGDIEGPIGGSIRGTLVCEVADIERKVGRANARLIAAAPDLLAALRTIANGEYDNAHDCKAAARIAAAAIAKATGGAS